MWVKICQHCTFIYRKFSRYLYRGVLPDKNIVSDIDGQVSFEYEDSQTKSTKVRTLSATKFLWLVLQHVLPKGLRRVRDYGLLRGNCSKLRQQIQLMLAVEGAAFPILPEVKRKLATRRCPCCQQPMRFMGVVKRTTNLIPAT
jgi:hypothetical protein